MVRPSLAFFGVFLALTMETLSAIEVAVGFGRCFSHQSFPSTNLKVLRVKVILHSLLEHLKHNFRKKLKWRKIGGLNILCETKFRWFPFFQFDRRSCGICCMLFETRTFDCFCIFLLLFSAALIIISNRLFIMLS